MNPHNTPAGSVTHIDTQRARRHARPVPLPPGTKLTEAELDARLQDQRAAADDSMGAILARRARAEREALAIAHGVRGDMRRYTDSQLDELDAIACAAEEGCPLFDRRTVAIALAAFAVIVALLWFITQS